MKQFIVFIIICFSLSIICVNSNEHNEIIIIQQINQGFDWSLPDNVKPAPNSGVFYMDQKPDNEHIRAVGRTFTWSEMNPQEDIYDFSKVKELLQTAKQHNLKVVLRIFSLTTAHKSPFAIDNKAPFVPQWVLNKHNPKEFYTYMGTGLRSFKENSDNHIKVAACWDIGLQKEYKKFIDKFGQQGFFEYDNLAGIYVTGFSTSYGEEFWLHKDYLQNALQASMPSIKEWAGEKEDWKNITGMYLLLRATLCPQTILYWNWRKLITTVMIR